MRQHVHFEQGFLETSCEYVPGDVILGDEV